MTVSISSRTYAVVAGVSLGALALAGCGSDGTEPDEGPTAPEDITAPGEPEFNDFGGTEPDPSATGVSRLESLEGTLSADIPNSWGQFPPETAGEALSDPAVTDVMGFWVAGADPVDQHSVVIMGQIQEDPPVGAQEYWDMFFGPVDDPEVSIEYEIFDSETDREVLLIDAISSSEAGLLEESVFFVFADSQVVIGLLSAPGAMNAEYRDQLRAVADSLEIA